MASVVQDREPGVVRERVAQPRKDDLPVHPVDGLRRYGERVAAGEVEFLGGAVDPTQVGVGSTGKRVAHFEHRR